MGFRIYNLLRTQTGEQRNVMPLIKMLDVTVNRSGPETWKLSTEVETQYGIVLQS